RDRRPRSAAAQPWSRGPRYRLRVWLCLSARRAAGRGPALSSWPARRDDRTPTFQRGLLPEIAAGGADPFAARKAVRISYLRELRLPMRPSGRIAEVSCRQGCADRRALQHADPPTACGRITWLRPRTISSHRKIVRDHP